MASFSAPWKSFIHHFHNKLSNEGGMALVVAMVLLAMLAFLGSAALMTSETEMDIAGNEKTYQMAFYAADGGGELGVRVLKDIIVGRQTPAYTAEGLRVNINYGDLFVNDNDVDYQDIQVAPPAIPSDLGIGIAVDRDASISAAPTGGQIPEPGEAYQSTVLLNFYYDLDSQSTAPRRAESDVRCKYKCAYDGAVCKGGQ